MNTYIESLLKEPEANVEGLLESLEGKEKEFVDFLIKELNNDCLYEFVNEVREDVLHESYDFEGVKAQFAKLRSKISDRDLINAFISFLPTDKLLDFINWCNISFKLYRQ